MRELCKHEKFKIAMGKIQDRFATICIMNTQAPAQNLRQQLVIWQMHASKEKKEPDLDIKEQIQKAESQIVTLDKEVEKAKNFCSRHTVRF